MLFEKINNKNLFEYQNEMSKREGNQENVLFFTVAHLSMPSYRRKTIMQATATATSAKKDSIYTLCCLSHL